MTDFTDELIKDYKIPHWSDLYNLKVNTVPQEFIDYETKKGQEYAETGFGYATKDYSNIAYTVQVDINANSDEATYLDLINTNRAFVDAVNHLIIDKSNAGKLYIEPSKPVAPLIVGKYKFNDNHGMTNHDVPQQMLREDGKTYIDLLHTGYDELAAWGIEIKTDNKVKMPTSVHRADIVLLHILGTDMTVIYMPTVERKLRDDSAYIKVGEVLGFGDWKNVRVDSKLNITKW